MVFRGIGRSVGARIERAGIMRKAVEARMLDIGMDVLRSAFGEAVVRDITPRRYDRGGIVFATTNVGIASQITMRERTLCKEMSHIAGSERVTHIRIVR